MPLPKPPSGASRAGSPPLGFLNPPPSRPLLRAGGGGGVGLVWISACAKGGDPRPVCPYLTGCGGGGGAGRVPGEEPWGFGDCAGSYSVAHRAGLLPTELTGMWGWILLRPPHQGRGSPPAPTPTKRKPAPFTPSPVGGQLTPASTREGFPPQRGAHVRTPGSTNRHTLSALMAFPPNPLLPPQPILRGARARHGTGCSSSAVPASGSARTAAWIMQITAGVPGPRPMHLKREAVWGPVQ